MAMTVVTATINNSSRPAEGFRHPEATFATISDGHLVLYTFQGGEQVAIYPPKMWMQVFEGTQVETVTDWKKFSKGDE